MATLKELRKRIRTVGGVRKITAVMRLVASARLKKAATANGTSPPISGNAA